MANWRLSTAYPNHDVEAWWKSLGYKLNTATQALSAIQYTGMLDAASPKELFRIRGVPLGSVTMGEIDSILSHAALAPPHGLDLLRPLPMPALPVLPEIPNRAIKPNHAQIDGYGNFDFIAQYETLKAKEEALIVKNQKLQANIEIARETIVAKIRDDEKLGADISAACRLGDAVAIRRLMLLTLIRHPLSGALVRDADFALDAISRVALCTIEVPDMSRLSIMRQRGESWQQKWAPVSEAERKRSSERVLHSLCIRAAYLIAMSDPGDFFDTVAVNAHQQWFDPATGNSREGIIASLQARKSDIQKLQPGCLEAKACFRHLAGISTPSVLNAAPIRPIFVMETDDNRIVANRDVASNLEQETNLATMPWEDFEHLVRQLFEWMFTNDGIEVKVTRASRDRGVDAIMFDPDPVRGGKYILQAKRYTRTVDVAAVRDLYGTIVNEGANRGILVTTASYGPDAYEFAKNKPISLIDGPNLLVLLRKHGRRYRIDLEEARRIESASEN